MLKKNITIILFSLLLYQSPSLSKSSSFDEFNSRNFSKYFSGIVAFENKKSSDALDFFKSSKILINKHDPYLQRFVISLVLEEQINQAINIIKTSKNEGSTEFFEAYILLALDSLKKNKIEKAIKILAEVPELLQKERFNIIIINSIKQYAEVFYNKKIPEKNENYENYGNLTFISETFQRCYLDDKKTNSFFLNLINNNKSDYSRYIYFYLTYLIEKNKTKEAKLISDELNYINSTLLISQGKNWIDNGEYEEFSKFFSCRNQNDILAEFLFLISNLFASQKEFEKSNFYLNLSIYLNPKFIFNSSLVAENLYLNKDYEKTKFVLKNFDKNKIFYYWYRSKKEAQIISKISNQKEALNYITSEFEKIKNPNDKFIFDIANFYKNSKKYDQEIKYYSLIINSLDDDNEIKADVLYRRGGSFERLKNYSNADRDLKHSLKINPDDAYVLNYLAYSWLERNHRINEAIDMLEIAYKKEKDDPYIIDSIGWAYYLIKDFVKAEKLLKRAVELMPDDPIVNDHYGDILWKLDRKIQARYFWSTVLKMEDAKQDLKNKIQIKIIDGPKSS